MSLLALVQALPGMPPPCFLPVDPDEAVVAGARLLLGLDTAARVVGAGALPILRGTGRRSHGLLQFVETHP